jgi:cell division protein FtsB
MELALDLKRRARLMIAPTVFLAIAGYFGWNATQGNRGLVAQAERIELLRRVEADNLAAKADRDRWERRVAGLRASQLNPDTLDERARAMLHLADPTDIVVQYPDAQKLF